MSTHEEKINEFLKSMGFSVQLQHIPPNPPETQSAIINHMGVNMFVTKDREIFLSVSAFIGFVPKVNVAPFFRKLLELQSILGGPFFAITPADNGVTFQVCRQLEGLDFIEFKWMLDTLAPNYWQRVAPLVQEFQIPQQAG